MANTGIEIVLTLQEVASPCPGDCTPTGNTKPNTVGDPDYIEPYINVTNCPIVFSDDCPVLIYTGNVNSIEVEFSLENAVVNNPSIAKITLTLTGTGGPFAHDFILPNTPSPNFFSHLFLGLASSTTYSLNISYFNSSDTLVKTCTDTNITTIS